MKIKKLDKNDIVKHRVFLTCSTPSSHNSELTHAEVILLTEKFVQIRINHDMLKWYTIDGFLQNYPNVIGIYDRKFGSEHVNTPEVWVDIE